MQTEPDIVGSFVQLYYDARQILFLCSIIASGSFTLSVMILESFGEEAVICDIFRTEHSMASHFLFIYVFCFCFLGLYVNHHLM